MGNVMPPLGSAHTIFGVEAEVTVEGLSPPYSTTAVRIRPGSIPTVGTLGLGAGEGIAVRATVSIPRADVPALPEGSLILADFGDGLTTYRVDRVDTDFPDEWRCVVS